MYWWNILVVVLIFVYLIAKVEQLHRRNKRLNKIIQKLEGVCEDHEEVEANLNGNTGDADGGG